MGSTDFKLEEYRHIAAAILNLDERIIKIFAITVGAVATLLAVASPGALGNGGPVPGIAAVYLALLPMAVVIAAFVIQISLRRDMARLGMYRRVFFEEGEQYGLRWELALGRFRQAKRRAETNDAIAASYALAVFVAFVLVMCGAYHHGSWQDAILPVAGVIYFARLCRAWITIYPDDAKAYLDE